MKVIFMMLSVLILISCTESLDIQLEPEVNVFFNNNGEKRVRLTPEDKEYLILNEWLGKHKTGWYSTSGRYPGGVYIKSGDYGIQVTNMNVVLYSTTHQEPKAIYIQETGKAELSEILNLGK